MIKFLFKTQVQNYGPLPSYIAGTSIVCKFELKGQIVELYFSFKLKLISFSCRAHFIRWNTLGASSLTLTTWVETKYLKFQRKKKKRKKSYFFHNPVGCIQRDQNTKSCFFQTYFISWKNFQNRKPIFQRFQLSCRAKQILNENQFCLSFFFFSNTDKQPHLDGKNIWRTILHKIEIKVFSLFVGISFFFVFLFVCLSVPD